VNSENFWLLITLRQWPRTVGRLALMRITRCSWIVPPKSQPMVRRRPAQQRARGGLAPSAVAAASSSYCT
jgi:hypothetical protein